MRLSLYFKTAIAFGAFVLGGPDEVRGEPFRVATYNLESYLDQGVPGRPAKTPESKAQIRHNLLEMRPDVVALQEVGSESALLELRDSLKAEGLNLPNWVLVHAADTNIHIGLLSKFRLASNRSRTNQSFLLDGRRFHVSRGFLIADIAVSDTFSFTLIAVHLKSRRSVPEADESRLRLEEAKLLRDEIDAVLSADPNCPLLIAGDFNDTRDSLSTTTVVGRGKLKLFDTRPQEQVISAGPPGTFALPDRAVTWTHYYPKEDSYRRIDYLLLSRQMARKWIAQETYVLSTPLWGLASDHRPLVATFETTAR